MGHESLATTANYVDAPLKQRTSAVSLLPVIPSIGKRNNCNTWTELEQFTLFD